MVLSQEFRYDSPIIWDFMENGNIFMAEAARFWILTAPTPGKIILLITAVSDLTWEYFIMLNKTGCHILQKSIKIWALCLVLLPIFIINAHAIETDVSLGAHFGLAPALGGDLGSRFQENTLGVNNGIEGINRSMSGIDTDKVERLLGGYGGIDFKVIFIKYLMIRLQANFTMNMTGGTGISLDQAENRLEVSYSFWAVDIPVQVGVSVPFGNTVRISLSGGIAFAYGTYSNSFKSATVNSSAEFTGWTFPWIIMLSGEFFLKEYIALTSSLVYYNGATDIIRSGSDYAKIDFGGFRWNIGFSYHFIRKSKEKK